MRTVINKFGLNFSGASLSENAKLPKYSTQFERVAFELYIDKNLRLACYFRLDFSIFCNLHNIVDFLRLGPPLTGVATNL